MKKLKKFIRLPFKSKLMMFEALFLSAYYRFQILHVPFAKLSKKIGIHGFETSESENYKDVVMAVRNVVEPVCRHTLWESKCLVRALTAKKILNKRGFPCTLYMGVAPGNDGNMEAHAWLRAGDMYVTGGNGSGYAVTAVFGDKEK